MLYLSSCHLLITHEHWGNLEGMHSTIALSRAAATGRLMFSGFLAVKNTFSTHGELPWDAVAVASDFMDAEFDAPLPSLI